MSEAERLEYVFDLLDEIIGHSRGNIVKELSVELGVSTTESLSYVEQWLFKNGE